MRNLYKIILLLRIVSAFALDHEVGVFGVLDNREFGGGFENRTIFFIRPHALIGTNISGEENHKIWGGLTFLQEFGARPQSENLDILAYYHYDGANAQFRFGSFLREGALDIPKHFFADENAYFRPFVHGAALSGKYANFEGSLHVDWTQLQSDTTGESFLFGYGAKYRRGIFAARHDFIMYHLTGTQSLAEPFDEVVWDNGGMSAETGVAISRAGFLDTLALSAGGVVSLARDRGGDGWETPAGAFLAGYAGKSFFALRCFLYAGEAQRVAWGAPFFSLDFEDALYGTRGMETFFRIDPIVKFVQRANVSIEFYPSVHFYSLNDGDVKKSGVGHTQHFLLHANIGRERERSTR